MKKITILFKISCICLFVMPLFVVAQTTEILHYSPGAGKLSNISSNQDISVISHQTSNAQKTTLTNCTDKINYVGAPAYWIQIGGHINSQFKKLILLQVYPSYTGAVQGVEFEASKFNAANVPLVVGMYSVNSLGVPVGGWITSSTVTINSTQNKTYTAVFSSPVNVTSTNGFAIGLLLGSNNQQDSVKAYHSAALSFGSPEYSHVYASNSQLYDFPTFFGNGFNAHMTIRPIVSTYVNPNWITAKTSTNCGVPVVCNFTNNTGTPPFYTNDPLICPNGYSTSLDYGDGTPPETNFNFIKTHTYTTVGSYTPSFTQTYVGWTNNCTETKTVVIDVDDPQPSFTYTANGLTVTFANTSQNLSNFVWNFGDLTSSTQQDPGKHVFPSPGTYVVELEGTAPCGKVRYVVSIVVTATSLNENKSLNELVTIYPNPASQFLKININEMPSTDLKIEIYNSIGSSIKSISSNVFNSKDVNVDVSILPKGIYFVKFITKNSSTVKSFVKE